MAVGRKPTKRKETAVAARRRVSPPSRNVTVVGVGASAGGLEAFGALIEGLPANPGLAIVFVQHLAPTHDSALVTLLSSHTSLPVIQATQDLEIAPDMVYVIPPNTQMVLVGTALHLNVRPDDRSQYTPIDTFFWSLAEAAGPQAIAVVLSGTGSDGALGIRAIKGAGGVTIAQTPGSARYDGMPRAAAATGMVDLVLAPPAIGAKLAELSQHAYAKSAGRSHAELPVPEDAMNDIFDIIRPLSGVDFRHYKPATIKRRLFRRMALHRISDVGQYVSLLRNEPAEARSLYQDLLIHVTRFFREPESFAALAREVFPAIVQGRPSNQQPIRAWVSGCSTGEEAYSLAISLVEYLKEHRIDAPIQIFATDVSESAVEQARTGVFPLNIEEDVSPERLRRFFTKVDGSYRVTKAIRDLCVFAIQDLTKDPPFSRLHLILCRNVLIYMDMVLQKKLLSVFHYSLNPDGFLALGQAETAGAQPGLFELVDKKYRIHRKKQTALAPAMSFPAHAANTINLPKKASPEPSSDKFLQSEVSRVLMDRFAPPGVVVDTDMQIVQFRGQTGPYLEPAPGEASLNILKMAREGMLYGLRTAIATARKTRAVVRKSGLQVRAGSDWKPVNVEVIPLSSTGRLHFLVLFHDAGKSAAQTKKTGKPPRARIATKERKTRVDFLQHELAASREYLQSIIQELEAANEELQSANEEILSSNEELQSTNEELDTAKEELQSTNEELNTVNDELHGRNEELSRVNSDLINLLASVQIAILIVSADLRIRRFTPTAEKALNLIPGDVDRLIGHINPNIVGANLEQLIKECIDTIAPVEREVQDRQGRWYSLRIRPYRTVDNKIDGAVVTLFDVDAPKRYEQSVRAAIALMEEVMTSSDKAIALLDGELRLRAASASFARIFAIPGRDRARKRPLDEFLRGDAGLDTLRKFADGGGGSPLAGAATLEPRQSAAPIAVEIRALAAFDGSNDRVFVLTADESRSAVPTA